jgi:hypothetical protein
LVPSRTITEGETIPLKASRRTGTSTVLEEVVTLILLPQKRGE